MVGFASLFLGLILGVNDVQLVAGADVARIVVTLDGEEVGVVKGAPWTVRLDLGSELAPHELVATGYTSEGRELGTARQWLNRPRPPAEVTVVVERRGPKRVARLSWQSITSATPKVVTVSVDGEPVPVADPREVALPDVDPDRLHLLRADLDFAGGVSAVQDLAFGGGRTDEASARLTAIPVILDKKAKLPPAEKLAGWFETEGAPLNVAAVEEGPADVVLVLGEGAREALSEIVRDLAPPVSARATSGVYRDAVRVFAPLKKDQRAWIVWTVAERREHSGMRYDLFPRSDEMTPKDGGMLYYLTQVQRASPSEPTPRVADALAVGALGAAGRDRRRAAVLVLGPRGSPDMSTLDPARAKRYLARLGVPLEVWCTKGDGDPAWGACREVSTAGHLNAAVHELTSLLERERIVWVEGTLLPHKIGLSGRASSIALAR